MKKLVLGLLVVLGFGLSVEASGLSIEDGRTLTPFGPLTEEEQARNQARFDRWIAAQGATAQERERGGARALFDRLNAEFVTPSRWTNEIRIEIGNVVFTQDSTVHDLVRLLDVLGSVFPVYFDRSGNLLTEFSEDALPLRWTLGIGTITTESEDFAGFLHGQRNHQEVLELHMQQYLPLHPITGSQGWGNTQRVTRLLRIEFDGPESDRHPGFGTLSRIEVDLAMNTVLPGVRGPLGLQMGASVPEAMGLLGDLNWYVPVTMSAGTAIQWGHFRLEFCGFTNTTLGMYWRRHSGGAIPWVSESEIWRTIEMRAGR